MNKPKNRFPLKILLGYVVLGALAVVVSYFLYQEYQVYVDSSVEETESEAIIETGNFITDVYETDSFARLALLTQKEVDFDTYLQKTEDLFETIDLMQDRISEVQIIRQLDSIEYLLNIKSQNIEQLRILKLAYDDDATLDDILREFKNFDRVVGRLHLEDIIKEPNKLPRSEQRAYQRIANLLTELNLKEDTLTVRNITIDSMVSISRYIVLEAKRENSYTRKVLKEKENELLNTELSISRRLTEIITDFEAEITKNKILSSQAKMASESRTQNILRIAALVGLIVIILFSYVIITDFFRAEKFKRNLQQSKQYAENILKSREQLMATVSHDLKTPLNTIVGYSELFSHTELSEKQKSYAQQINASAQFINKMVDDLQDFSKLEAGKLSIDFVPFSLENLLNQVAKVAKDIHIDKPVSLHLFIDDDLKGKHFESDPLRIQQIIHNLVGNAFKFTESGKIQIAANVLKIKKDKFTIEIAVTDTGIGISEEKQELIFQEFTQAEQDTFKKFGGSGLGLAISKKIAALLNGNLKVKSKLHEGSTFFLTLPMRLSQKIQLAEDTAYEQEHQTGLKALIIDDDPAMVKLLKELLAQMNIHALGFTSYHELFEQPNLRFDFVLTDIEIPQINGFEGLEKIKDGALKNYSKQPVIAMTGNRQHPNSYYLEKGFTDMLEKPFSKNKLVAALSPLFINKIKDDIPIQEVFNNSTSEIYDLTFLQSFLGNHKSMDEVLQIFFHQTEKDMNRIETAIEDYDCDTLNEVSHRMLTMCRQLSAKRVNPILETMERCALEPITKKEMDVLYRNLKVEITTLIESLKQELVIKA